MTSSNGSLLAPSIKVARARIGVQRILIHESKYETIKEKLIAATQQLPSGDPRQEQTFVGPMISDKEAKRLQGWIDAAVSAGAKCLCGGQRDGAMMPASLFENVPDDCDLAAEEAFGPVAILESFNDYSKGLARINASKFGLQAGIFTRDIYRSQQAWDELEVGGVIIGDVPSWRVDHMPYGGVKRFRPWT